MDEFATLESMMGSSDDDSGEEEVIGGSAEVFAPPPSVDPAPLASCPDGWTRHRSARYRNATAPDGYEYFHCTSNKKNAISDQIGQAKLRLICISH
jgi:hypothetical protein